MLVVVYLVLPKKNIIIPQEWIMSLSQETLNNIGKASYQNRRIFWSNVGVDPDGIPDSSITPNFQQPISMAFPPSNNEACYIARVKCYCATVARAKYFRDTFRPQLPLLYNARKQNEAPLPALPLNIQSENHSNSSSQLPNEIPIENSSEVQVEPSAGPSINRNPSINENLDEFNQELEEQNQTADTLETELESNCEDDTKSIMPNVELDELDSIAVSNFLDDEQLDMAQPELASNETSFFENGMIKIKTVVSDDCEMVYTYGAKITPYTGFDLKVNDPISMNIPFKENVSFSKEICHLNKFYFQCTRIYLFQANGDRAYLIVSKEGAKEISLAAKIVNGLKQMNAEGKRQNSHLDQNFVKVLLVGLVGTKAIRTQGVNENVIRFVKGTLIT